MTAPHRAVATAAEVREADRHTIEEVGVPGVALMQTASEGLARAIATHHHDAAMQGVTVVCGPGNNGGDGYGCARWLHAWGYPVALWPLSETSSGDADTMRQAADRAGVPTRDGIGRPGLIVDAVFGTGLSREVTGELAEVLLRMDTHPAPVVAADLPSGLCADTGRVLGTAVDAVRTVTFGALKRGLFGVPGADRCGEITLVDLGFGDRAVGAELVDGPALAARWPVRAAGDHKGRGGRLMILAGSTAMVGAAVLVAEGALAAGASLITLVVPRGAVPRLAPLSPSVMVRVAGEGDLLELHRLPPLDRLDALAVGPGLAGGEALPPHTEMALASLWAGAELPVVVDADGLAAIQGRCRGPRVITPHPGEAARLLGCGVADVQADRFGAATRLADETGAVALLKGRHTLVARRGVPLSVNTSGAPTLATGGSGDVLTGVIGALLARGVDAHDAARLGAYAHGRAGEHLARAPASVPPARAIARAVAEVTATWGTAQEAP